MIKLEHPKLYIVSPAEFEIDTFAEQLKSILDTVEVSCFRLALSTQDEKIIGKSADLVRHICLTKSADFPIIFSSWVDRANLKQETSTVSRIDFNCSAKVSISNSAGLTI